MNAENVWREYGMLDKTEKLEFLSFLLDNVSPEDVKQAKTIKEKRKQKEQQECEAKTKEENERMRVRKMPDTAFPPLFRNRVHDPNGLQTWLDKASDSDIKTLLEMYSNNPNNFRSVLQDVNEALSTLKGALKNK